MAKRRFPIDWFVIAILIAVVIGSLIPATGIAVPIVSWGSTIAIALLFFFYGVRLKPEETLNGLKHWRLHLTILSDTYIVFPIIGLLTGILVPELISPEVYRGLLWLCLLPSTVQSSVNFTSIAGGNVAGAIVSASTSNLLGVFITPLLAIALMHTTGLHLHFSSIFAIAFQILLPFILGQLSRRWLADFVARHPKLKYFDQISILLVVYKAFSQARNENIWHQTGLSDIAIIVVFSVVVLAFMLWFTWTSAGWLKFDRADRIAIQFCGTKKSLATGVPMASVMFNTGVGLIVLPLMIFHMLQLIVCGLLASRYAAQNASADPQTGTD